MNKLVIPFTFTAAQVNTFDSVASGSRDVGGAFSVVLGTNSRAVRVPTRLELVRAAGTAYTLTTSITGTRRPERAQPDPENIVSTLTKGAFLELYETDNTHISRVWFRVPLVGFLDSASEQLRISLPLNEGAVLAPVATTWKIRTTCPIASGTGSLTGRLYIDEYLITS